MKTKPMVSVSLITYNQVKYIRRAIESILAQKVNFEYEIIVGDDFSSDGTREVILEYKKLYPDIIKPILHSQRNCGIPGKINFVSTIYASTGKYIALLDGDDFWDDPYKLQKQLDFLEQNFNYVLSFHDSVIVDENEQVLLNSKLGKKRSKDLTSEEVISGALIPANTVVFRNGFIKHFPEEFFNVLNGDTFTFALLAQFGEAHFHEDINPSKYRRHVNGVWSSEDWYKKQHNVLNTYNQLSKVIDSKYKYLTLRKIYFYSITLLHTEPRLYKRISKYWSISKNVYWRSFTFKFFVKTHLLLVKQLIKNKRI